MATCSSILAWKIPRTEEPGRLQLWGHKESDMTDQLSTAAAAKSLQSCPTLCNPIDGSPPGSPVPGLLQARTLEWVAISFSNAWKWKVKVKSLSCAQLLVTPWTVAYQAPPSVGFSNKSTGVGCHCLLRNWAQGKANQHDFPPTTFLWFPNPYNQSSTEMSTWTSYRISTLLRPKLKSWPFPQYRLLLCSVPT